MSARTPINTRGLAPQEIAGTLMWRWSLTPGVVFAELWPDTPPALAVQTTDDSLHGRIVAYAVTAAEARAARAGRTFGDLYRLCPLPTELATRGASALALPAPKDST